MPVKQISANAYLIHKEIGQTPLEALERFRAEMIAVGQADFAQIPMTYAGRLDPMAEGKLIVLVGDECKNKDKYLGLDKEYEVEVLFGVATDTGDGLGLITEVCIPAQGSGDYFPDAEKILHALISLRGKFSQDYPAYSSKTVGGRQLHVLAKEGDLPEKMPAKEVEIYSIERMSLQKKAAADIALNIISKIEKVSGDFRQREIIEGWERFSRENESANFHILKIRVSCSSGTYMRSLAERLGALFEMPAMAFSINRTKIGEY